MGVGKNDGTPVGSKLKVGHIDGSRLGSAVGAAESVGFDDGSRLGFAVGAAESVGFDDGDEEGTIEGTFDSPFPNFAFDASPFPEFPLPFFADLHCVGAGDEVGYFADDLPDFFHFHSVVGAGDVVGDLSLCFLVHVYA